MHDDQDDDRDDNDDVDDSQTYGYDILANSHTLLRRESHACGLKTSISRRLMLAGQFLPPD